jgi:hypothetical protein
MNAFAEVELHCKQRLALFPVPSRDVTNQTLPGQERFVPGQGEFG